ncbi:DUF6630 family protein [Kutzneria buriramensis]|uniref:DUF6630 domain-containing protein n=1 Tax=Kutzneria buriramensis TaxID=1045776 RepID=A0A3E0H2M6_9PSEU|nr:DUF6630 family protein [Kutzneria buriramensis]REH36280.1 hypothetical protein BCF44_116149 [Kutzneria buriramensis]
MTERDALLAVATLLAPAHADVAERTLSAHDDPEAFLAEHADRLDDRGIDEAIPDLAWIALVDALDDHRLLAEIDWHEDPQEIVAQLRRLDSAPDAPEVWVDEDLPTYEFCQSLGSRLRAAGTTLAALDIESDCYPLVLLPNGDADTLVALASTAGFKAFTF